MEKLKILLVPDYLSWILGTWAKQIVRASRSHDYYYFPQQMLPYYHKEWESLIESVDLVHVLSPLGMEQMKIPADLPTIGSIHHVTDWGNMIPITSKSDMIMTVANEWMEYVIQQGVPVEKTCLINNGVDTSLFFPQGDRLIARKKIGINSDIPLIGFSGKYTSNTDGRKGIDILLDTFKKLGEMGLRFGVLLTGPGWKKMVQQIKNFGIGEIYYYPYLPDRLMPTCYNALDLYVVTAKIEGGPVPVLNCMACGVPVVTTPVGIVRDYIEDGKNGLIVPKDDAGATADAISQLLHSEELRKKLSNAGLETIIKHLTWDKTLAGIEHLYQRVWQAKLDKRGPLNKISPDPLQQRNKTLEIDTYLWNLKLAVKGHPVEGLRGIIKGGGRIVLKETPRLLMKECLRIFFKKRYGDRY